MLAAPGHAQANAPTATSPTNPAETYLNIQDDADLAARRYDSCRAGGATTATCWEHCAVALAGYSAALRDSQHADIAPLRSGRALAQRCKQGLERETALVCLAGAPSQAHAVCTYLHVDFDLAQRRHDARLVPEPLAWWEAFARADAASLQGQHEVAANAFDQAYDRCERSSYQGSQHCLPLVREALHSRQLAYFGATSRPGIEASLRLVDRALQADDRACQLSNSPTVKQVCALQQDLLLLHGGALVAAGQYREAADEYERAYDSCMKRQETAPTCWDSYGAASWRERQKLVASANATDREQRSRAMIFLNRFLTDMRVRCDDPVQVEKVRDVCHDLQRLETPTTPNAGTKPDDGESAGFIAAVLPGDLMGDPLAGCGSGPKLVDCLPALRSTTLARTAAIRSATTPVQRAELLKLGSRDVDNFLRQTGVNCSRVDISPAARACPLAQELAQLRREPPSDSVIVQAPPPREQAETRSTRRPLLVAGAVSMSIGALGLGVLAGGMVLGHKATGSGETSPLDNAQQLRDTTKFRQGEAGNRMVVAGAIVGTVAITVGVVLLVADVLGRRRRDERRTTITGQGLQVTF